MPMPLPSSYVFDHHVTVGTLKKDLQTVVGHRELPDLDLNISPDLPLYCVMNFCYHCWLSIKGVDVEAQRLFMANQSKILNVLLKACSQPNIPQTLTITSTHGLDDVFDIIFDEKKSVLTFALRFYTGRNAEGPTTYVYSNTDVLRLTSLDNFKKSCLQTTIQRAHDAGEIADLSEVDLSKFDTQGVQFDRTKVSASDLRHLAGLNRTVSLIGAEVVGALGGADLMLVDLKIDKKLALQLIAACADKRGVLDAYLKTQRALNRNTKIDLSGFDLRDVDLNGFDFRDVNFKNAIVRKPRAFVSERDMERRLILDERVWNWSTHLMPDSSELPVSEKRLIPVHASFVELAKDVQSRLDHYLPLPEVLSFDLMMKNGHIQLGSIPGTKAPNFKTVSNADSLKLIQRSVFCEMLVYEDYVNCGTDFDYAQGIESRSQYATQEDTSDYGRAWPLDVAIRFANSLPCKFHLKVELVRFLCGKSDQALNAPLLAYLTVPPGIPLINQLTAEDVAKFEHAPVVASGPDPLIGPENEGRLDSGNAIKVQPAHMSMDQLAHARFHKPTLPDLPRPGNIVSDPAKPVARVQLATTDPLYKEQHSKLFDPEKRMEIL